MTLAIPPASADTSRVGFEPGDANTHTFNAPYEIVDGTGIFEGASGHGRISGTAVATFNGTPFGAIDLEWTMDGTVRLPD